MNKQQERRGHSRYDTEVKIYFDISYDIDTKVEYEVMDVENHAVTDKQLALGKNVSTEGLCFVSKKKLEPEAHLNIEVYVPGSDKPINMKGEVRWSRAVTPEEEERQEYSTGVKVLLVNGSSVYDSICRLDKYNVEWSNVLDSVLGNYGQIAKQRKQEKGE